MNPKIDKMIAERGVNYFGTGRLDGELLDEIGRLSAVAEAAKGFMIHGVDKKGTHGALLLEALKQLEQD